MPTTKSRLKAVQFHGISSRRISAAIREYSDLLDSKRAELTIQRFLASHVYFFNGLARHHDPVYSRVKFGADFEADFAFYDSSSYGVEWHFVEIENPGKKMFARNGRPSANLTHAIEQARDWNNWIRENVQFARRSFPLILYPFFYVFMGRRSDLTAANRDRLRQINYDNRAWLEVGSLDRFIDCAKTAKNLSGLQLQAYTDAEMRRGLPEDSFEWLTSEHTKLYKGRNPRRLLNDRIRSDVGFSDD